MAALLKQIAVGMMPPCRKMDDLLAGTGLEGGNQKKRGCFQADQLGKTGRQFSGNVFLLNRAKGLGIQAFHIPIMARKSKILKIASTGR